MPNSPRSWKESASCQLDWQPSGWLIALLPVLGACGALSLLLSGLPRSLTWSGAVIAMLYGVVLARKESLKEAVAFELDGSTVDVDGEPVESFCVFWRGPLTFARWVDGSGQVRRLVWWPDTLDVAARRELRLALPMQNAARAPRSVAP